MPGAMVRKIFKDVKTIDFMRWKFFSNVILNDFMVGKIS